MKTQETKETNKKETNAQTDKQAKKQTQKNIKTNESRIIMSKPTKSEQGSKQANKYHQQGNK